MKLDQIGQIAPKIYLFDGGIYVIQFLCLVHSFILKKTLLIIILLTKATIEAGVCNFGLAIILSISSMACRVLLECYVGLLTAT